MTGLKKVLARIGAVVCALAVAALTVLFFTNDFGLVDLRKTSVVVGVGIDREGEDIALTAQLAIPQAAENGEKTVYSSIVGRGAAVAEALNEINVKTGFYPKLVFCELILLGESVLGEDIFATLDYFYRNEYTGLTPKVAACEGSAGEALSTPLPLGDSATDSIMRLLSEEALRSANVSTVDLRDIGVANASQGDFCYMPYISLENGTEERSAGSGGQEGAGKSGGQGSEGSSGAGGSGKSGEQSGFMCNRCAVFSGGVLAGVLDERQTFTFNLIDNEVRHALIKCGEGESMRVVGLRDCNGGAVLHLEDVPVLELNFSAIVRVHDGERRPTPQSEGRKQVSAEELSLCEGQLKEDFTNLHDRVQQLGCDLFDVRGKLYRQYPARYSELKDSILSSLELRVNISLRSAA